MEAAVEVQELANARPGRAPPAMAPPGLAFGDQAGPREGGLHEGVGEDDAVVAAGHLAEGAGVEAHVARAVEAQDDFLHFHARSTIGLI